MLDIDIEFRKGVLFIRLKGKLIDSTKDILKEEVISLMNGSGIANIVINLDNIESIDEKGIDMIYLLKTIVESKQGSLVICNTPMIIENKLIHNKMKSYILEATNELTALKIFNI